MSSIFTGELGPVHFLFICIFVFFLTRASLFVIVLTVLCITVFGYGLVVSIDVNESRWRQDGDWILMRHTPVCGNKIHVRYSDSGRDACMAVYLIHNV